MCAWYLGWGRHVCLCSSCAKVTSSTWSGSEKHHIGSLSLGLNNLALQANSSKGWGQGLIHANIFHPSIYYNYIVYIYIRIYIYIILYNYVYIYIYILNTKIPTYIYITLDYIPHTFIFFYIHTSIISLVKDSLVAAICRRSFQCPVCRGRVASWWHRVPPSDSCH